MLRRFNKDCWFIDDIDNLAKESNDMPLNLCKRIGLFEFGCCSSSDRKAIVSYFLRLYIVVRKLGNKTVPFCTKRSIHSKYYTNQILWNVYKFDFLFTPFNPNTMYHIQFKSLHVDWILIAMKCVFLVPGSLIRCLNSSTDLFRVPPLTIYMIAFDDASNSCDCNFSISIQLLCQRFFHWRFEMAIWLLRVVQKQIYYIIGSIHLSLHHILHSKNTPLDLLHNSIISKCMTYSCCLQCMRETIWINNQCSVLNVRSCQTSLTQYTNLIQLCMSRYWASAVQFARNILLRS